MIQIPYGQWERREHADFYNAPEIPFYAITANINVTSLVEYCKKIHISFYSGMIYATMTVINQLDDFKYRLRGDMIVLHDSLLPSFTVLEKGSRLHKIVNAPIQGSMKEFADYAKVLTEAQKNYFPCSADEERDDFVYLSCFPWVSFTSLTNTLGFDKNDFIPRLAWGKYFEAPGDALNGEPSLLLPFSMQVNHRANDGLHVGEFYQGIQQYINQLQ